MQHRVYIAGPFFNPAQIALMEKIESMLEAAGIDFFSPRLSEESVAARKDGFTRKHMRDIFQRDLEEIKVCSIILAVLDWVSPDFQQVNMIDLPSGVMTPLNIPDSGTVWEMGFALAVGQPIIGFTTDMDRTLNLMLTESCFMICRGWNDIQHLTDMLGCWGGGVL